MSNSIEAVKNALLWRHQVNGFDLAIKYGPQETLEAIQEQAEFSGSRELEEIGSSDVSCWMKSVEETLERQATRALDTSYVSTAAMPWRK